MMIKLGITFVFFLFFIIATSHSFSNSDNWLSKIKEDDSGDNKNTGEKCFCKLKGDADDCECSISSIDSFNNYKLHPRLEILVEKPFFRYIKMNSAKICKFWADDARCTIKDCQVKVCNEENLINSLKKYFKGAETELDSAENCEQSNPLGHLNDTITDDNLKSFEEWQKFDESQDNFCELDDEDSEDMQYADLVLNSERYTGYTGTHAHKIWNSIYRENCFADQKPSKPSYQPESDTCLEKRAFYRLISGLHSSINIHLCASYLHKGSMNLPDKWAPNPGEFKRRFDPATTDGQGPQWLKNLYFIYLVELRAITKASDYLEKQTFFSGPTTQDDMDTKMAVIDILKLAKSFENQFDETQLFKGNSQLKEQFQLKFRNITRIIDCVGCDKCRLWGKVQTVALGTALKILFSGKTLSLESTNSKTFQLSRLEIVSLFNGFARLSNSISQIENFRELLKINKNIDTFENINNNSQQLNNKIEL